MAKRDVVSPTGRQALYEQNAYSAAVRSGDFLFVSDQVGSREDGSPGPEFAAQVQLAFDNLQSVLKAAGASFEDIVDVTSFHTDPEAQFATVMEAKARAFPEKPYPNWTAVGVTWLAGFNFEIKVIARAGYRQKVPLNMCPSWVAPVPEPVAPLTADISSKAE